MSTTHMEEQQMIADSVRRWTQQACAPALRAQSTQHATGCPPARWNALAEMGWLAFPIPENDEGLGGNLADIGLLAEELGRGLLVEPFVACGVMATTLMAGTATGALRAEWLPAMAQGERRLALAAWEPQHEGLLSAPQSLATRTSSGWQVQGAKGLNPGLAGADGLLVVARLADQAAHLGVFLVAPDAHGVQLHNQRLYDGRHAATLHLENTPAQCVLQGPTSEIQALLQRAIDYGVVAHCAETTGAAAAAYEITLDYVKTRRQFGRSISSNQTIQHRLVDLYVEIEEVKALWRMAANNPAPRHVAALAIRTTDMARHVWEEAVQLHGAIGMTEEYVLGEYVRRLALASSLYGSTPQHLKRLSSLTLEIQA